MSQKEKNIFVETLGPVNRMMGMRFSANVSSWDWMQLVREMKTQTEERVILVYIMLRKGKVISQRGDRTTNRKYISLCRLDAEVFFLLRFFFYFNTEPMISPWHFLKLVKIANNIREDEGKKVCFGNGHF